jgi:hypothetical protein
MRVTCLSALDTSLAAHGARITHGWSLTTVYVLVVVVASGAAVCSLSCHPVCTAHTALDACDQKRTEQ